jgi:TRAP transporter TAXI family solute receptor
MSRKNICLAFALALSLTTTATTTAATRFLSIATGGTSGVYYPIGGALATVLDSAGIGFKAAAESTGASIENIGLIERGEAELAILQNDAVYYASTGTEMFKGQQKNKLAGIATLYNEPFQLVATKPSGITTYKDLAGKKVAWGAPGSVNISNIDMIMQFYNMTQKSMTVDLISFAESADQLKNGAIDASFIFAGIPTSAIIDVASQHEITIVPMTNDIMDKVIAQYPMFSKTVIPAGTYNGQKEDVPTLCVRSMLITSTDMSEDDVYHITKTLFEKLGTIQKAHKQAANISLETALEGMSIPLHPGAVKYYREKGILKGTAQK